MASQSHKALDPLWRRALLVAFCAAWAVFELVWGDRLWSTLAVGMTAYGAWLYLIAYKPTMPEE
jgi:hypothetical protein